MPHTTHSMQLSPYPHPLFLRNNTTLKIDMQATHHHIIFPPEKRLFTTPDEVYGGLVYLDDAGVGEEGGALGGVEVFIVIVNYLWHVVEAVLVFGRLVDGKVAPRVGRGRE